MQTVATFALRGAASWGNAHRYVDSEEKHYRDLKARDEAKRRAEIQARVTRMNAARAAKHVRNDVPFQQFLQTALEPPKKPQRKRRAP